MKFQFGRTMWCWSNWLEAGDEPYGLLGYETADKIGDFIGRGV